jgi:dethiobiotin synthetase
MINFPKTFFISGTDTDIGKTFVSAIITAGLKANYWKPIQSGTIEGTDTGFVKAVTKLPESHFYPELVSLKEPLSPHEAAELEHTHIAESDLIIPDELLHLNRHLVIEGAGGLMVPVNWEFMIIDLIKKWDLPVVLVVRSALGTLNHSLLSVEALRQRGIPIFGIIMNGPLNSGNANSLARLTGLPILAQIPEIKEVDNLNFEALFQEFFSE